MKCRQTLNRIDDYNDLLETMDYAATSAQMDQRSGRVGRTKRGACVVIKNTNGPHLSQSLNCSDGLCKVQALSKYHERITLDSLDLCPVSTSLIEEAKHKVREIQFSSNEMYEFLTKASLSMKDAKIIFKARSLGVGYEMAALLAMKCVGQWIGAQVFNLQNLVASISSEEGQVEGVPKIGAVRELFQDVVENLWLEPMPMSERALLEGLAVAFLSSPERLVCAHLKKQEKAAFLGETFIDFPEDGNFVVVLMKNTFKGLRCALYLPCTEEVFARCGMRPLLKSAKVVGDSTFMNFRAEVCQKLRVLGYDVKKWMSRPGAEEHQVAVD